MEKQVPKSCPHFVYCIAPETYFRIKTETWVKVQNFQNPELLKLKS